MRNVSSNYRTFLPAFTLTMTSLTASAATLTTVQAPWPGEATHAEILGSIFGGTFTASGDDFTNGALNAVRVDDDFDQVWPSDVYNAQAKARYADFEQQFGYLDESGTYTPLFDVDGNETSVTGSATLASLFGPVRFVRNGTRGLPASTQPSDNSDLRDHAVTYRIASALTDLPVSGPTQILEPGDEETYVLFFEDLPEGDPYADFDFNDLVVTLTRSSAVPEPGAIALLGLGGALMLGRRRRD